MIKRLALILSFFVLPSFAGISDDLDSFFDSLGFQTNTTGAGAYQGQSAGLYTGGQLFARNEVRRMNLANVQLPSYRAGCGGIDMYMGGFSFIDTDEFVNLLEAVGNNAVGFAWMLAMDTVSPAISGVTKDMQATIDKINQFNINSCEAAAALVGSAWPKTDESQRAICANVGVSSGAFSDMAASRLGCGAEGQRAKIMEQNKDGEYKALIVSNTNIAWQAIKENKWLISDPELAQLFMSMTGTIIIKTPTNDKDRPEYITKPPIIEDNSLAKALLYGSNTDAQINIYKCMDNEDCVDIDPERKPITINKGFVQRVEDIIDSITTNIVLDLPLEPHEISFLNSTSLPIYKMMNVEAGYSQSGALLSLPQYAELIAIDILYQYLNETLSVMLASAQQIQNSEELVKQYAQGIVEAKRDLQAAQKSTQDSIMATIEIVSRTQKLEQHLAGILTSQQIAVLGWGQGAR